MTSHWLFQLGLLAVLLAWVVGAYNRLVRLRTAIISAWEQIVAALVKRSEAMAAVANRSQAWRLKTQCVRPAIFG